MTRQPSPADLDALAAWWLSKRHIGRAALLLGKKRQTVANQLQQLKRLVGRQHGVVAVSVIVREDGVVAPQHRTHSTPTEDGGE